MNLPTLPYIHDSLNPHRFDSVFREYLVGAARDFNEKLVANKFCFAYGSTGDVRLLHLMFNPDHFAHLIGIESHNCGSDLAFFRRCLSGEVSAADVSDVGLEPDTSTFFVRKARAFPSLLRIDELAKQVSTYNGTLSLKTDLIVSNASIEFAVGTVPYKTRFFGEDGKTEVLAYRCNSLLSYDLKTLRRTSVDRSIKPILVTVRGFAASTRYDELSYVWQKLDVPRRIESLALIKDVAPLGGLSETKPGLLEALGLSCDEREVAAEEAIDLGTRNPMSAIGRQVPDGARNRT